MLQLHTSCWSWDNIGLVSCDNICWLAVSSWVWTSWVTGSLVGWGHVGSTDGVSLTLVLRIGGNPAFFLSQVAMLCPVSWQWLQWIWTHVLTVHFLLLPCTSCAAFLLALLGLPTLFSYTGGRISGPFTFTHLLWSLHGHMLYSYAFRNASME